MPARPGRLPPRFQHRLGRRQRVVRSSQVHRPALLAAVIALLAPLLLFAALGDLPLGIPALAALSVLFLLICSRSWRRREDWRQALALQRETRRLRRLAASAAAPRVEAIDAPQDAGALLLIEPDIETRESLRRILFSGRRVIAAATLEQALQLVTQEAQAPDIFLCPFDPGVEGIDGVTVVERLRDEFNRHVPALLLTSGSSAEQTARAAAGDCLLLPLPIEPGVLHDVIARAADRAPR